MSEILVTAWQEDKLLTGKINVDHSSAGSDGICQWLNMDWKRSFCQLQDQMLIDRHDDGWHNGYKKPTCGHDATVAPLTNSVTLKVSLDVWCCWCWRHDDFWNSWSTGVPECSSILIQVIVGSVFTVLSTCPGKRILLSVRINTHSDGRQTHNGLANRPRGPQSEMRKHFSLVGN